MQVLAFLNSILLLNQMNQVVVIATGYNSCDYVFDSSSSSMQRAECLLEKLEEFVDKDESLSQEDSVDGVGFSLLSGSLSMALCCILNHFMLVWLFLSSLNCKFSAFLSFMVHSYEFMFV